MFLSNQRINGDQIYETAHILQNNDEIICGITCAFPSRRFPTAVVIRTTILNM